MILKEHKDSLGQNVAENHTFQIKSLKAFSFPKLVQATILLRFLSAQVHCHIQRILSHSGSQLLQSTISCAEFSDSCLHWLCWILQLRLRTLQSVVLCTTLTDTGGKSSQGFPSPKVTGNQQEQRKSKSCSGINLLIGYQIPKGQP